jgi:hypothetical protein
MIRNLFALHRPVLVTRLTLLVLSAVIGGSALAAAPQGSIFDPDSVSYTNLGAQTFSSGTLTFNTDTLTVTHSILGVIGTGNFDLSASGAVQMAVFSFQSLSISSGVTISITGTRGLALASRTDLFLDTTLDVSGGNGVAGAATAGLGGPGAEGGVRNGTPASAPPSATGGDGGTGMGGGVAGADGTGVGAGSGGSGTSSGAGAYSAGGGGGSYGGLGGHGQGAVANPATVVPGQSGASYGIADLTDLFGGSGGGGGSRASSGGVGGGGGGGGTLALLAEGTLTIGINGQLLASGGDGGVNPVTGNPIGGGGGSGGGILLAADAFSFQGLADASGGAGGFNIQAADRPGGGGGGGRVAFYYDTLIGNLPTAVVIGGATEGSATAGAAGSVSRNDAPEYLAVPEPSTAAFLGLTLLAAGTGRFRRPRR